MSGQTLQKAFVPLAGGAVAVYTSSGLAYYRHKEGLLGPRQGEPGRSVWLGSSRFASTPTRTMYSDEAYAPFGEPYAQSGTADLSFTGQNQDTVSGVYDFPAREYATQGRWPSPDPSGMASAYPTDPQSWNRYAYVRNTPLHNFDPTGLKCLEGGDCDVEDGYGSGDGSDGGDSGGGGGGACYWDDGTHDDSPVNGGASQDQCGAQGGTWIPTLTQTVTVKGTNDSTPAGNGFSGNSSGGFFSGIKDKFLDFLAAHANYLPGVCTAGAFGYGTGGAGNDKGGGQGGLLIDKQVGKPRTVQPLGEVGYGPVGVGVTPAEALVFVSPVPKVDAGVVFAADWHNGFINNSGISIGLFAGKAGNKGGLAGGVGGGAYLTFSSAANCLKNF